MTTDILCLVSHHSVGGAQNVAVRLTSAFRERGYRAELGFLFQENANWNCGIKDRFIIAERKPKTLTEWWHFFTRCRAECAMRAPLVAIGFHPLANIIGALMVGKSGRFISSQAWPATEQSRGTERVENLLCRTPLIYRNIAVSGFVASTFAHRGKAYARKTEIIYNDPPTLPVIEDDKPACQKKLGITTGVPVLGCIGRLHEQKNFQLAIRTLPYVPSAHLFIAGDGTQEAMLRALAVKRGVDARVHFLGPLVGADVSRFYRAVDWLLMPSLYEGHPLVMLEAMASGAPVISHDVPVMREAGADAALYCSSEPINWAETLANLDEPRRQEMIAKGKARAAHFAQTSMVDEYLRMMSLPAYKQEAL
ncbi:glycosyltransferase [Thalassospira xianhensis]|uniref:Uncharacterized protein n=1 Tax=Thalassospira xianhensis MCCC 1A02616 TaxID=1177929 RepID=A0A367U6M4_9PROT|nr:glycosyltransferase [Thalassospira xianhensis]RCK03947.1 hypothetical protein TH5_22720 [Thalassospira xianhensis MCCC 1A02616]